jgi:hypothetical protein
MPTRLLGVALLFAVGCTEQEKTTLVPSLPIGNPAVQTAAKMPQAPATEAAALRVAAAGRQVLQANPHLGVRPQFICIGTREPVLFHQLQRDSCMVYVSEGLLQQCRDDGQLAAVLCTELGRVVAEKASTFNSTLARTERRPPPGFQIGRDDGGPFGAPDGTHLYELARTDKEREEAATPRLPPSPEALARTFLEHAGYPAAQLQAVEPLLRATEQNTAFDKAVNNGQPAAAPVK